MSLSLAVDYDLEWMSLKSGRVDCQSVGVENRHDSIACSTVFYRDVNEASI